MLRIAPARVRRALTALQEWWLSAPSQGSKHLLPLLALLEKGAGDGAPVHFEERPDEYAFWDRYFSVAGSTEKPYFNPLTLRRAEKDFPHSNAATIRKNTFRLKWKAASLSEGASGESLWTLDRSYAEIFRDKGLTKGGLISRVPVVDLGCVLFRSESFAPDATHEAIVALFRERFRQTDADFGCVFEVQPEESKSIFVAREVGNHEYDSAVTAALVEDTPAPGPLPGGETTEPPPLEAQDDAVLVQVRELLALKSSGIILRGVPGTGKTWYAQRIAASLVQDPKLDIFRVQFHPSYGYEDFVEGYRPNETAKSGFQVENKVFLEACERAKTLAAGYVVVVVDEINRGDPARIFGDLLTYLEHSYRGKLFHLAYSGEEQFVPANLIVLGTMNPYDRSIAQLDAAFLRRFDHIDLPPSVEAVGMFLEEAGTFSSTQVTRVQQWFEALQQLVPNGIGHTYFKDVSHPEHLPPVWRYRMWPVVEAALEFDAHRRLGAKASFDSMYRDVTGRGDVNEDASPGAVAE